MSTEESEEFTYNIEKRLSDDKVLLIDNGDGSRAILLKVTDEADVKDRCSRLERSKKSSLTDESRQFNYMPPATYNILPQNTTIKITGDLDELEDAAGVLHQCHNYISSQKMSELVKELYSLRLKDHQQRWEKERHERKAKNAKKEAGIQLKYTRLAIKLGMDPNSIFPNSPEDSRYHKTDSSTVMSKFTKKK